MKKTGWTGERLETFVHNSISIEHLHRYSMALPYTKNKRVLDIACGEGYGTNLIATEAEFVYGVDIDQQTIDLAIVKYRSDKILFKQGSADQIPLENNQIDVVVSFETLEHHDRHQEMLAEIKRVLRPGGLLIMSSPEAGISGFNHNPFHIKELTNGEFQELINTYFKHVNYYYQRIVMGSMIHPQTPFPAPMAFHEGDYSELRQLPQLKDHVYNICFASDAELRAEGGSFFDGQQVLTDALVFPYLNSRVRKWILAFRKLTGLKSAHS